MVWTEITRPRYRREGMVAAIGNGAAFARGRDYSAWLGLVPKQMSTGDRTILGRISKRGNGYLRTLFMTGIKRPMIAADASPNRGSSFEMMCRRVGNVPVHCSRYLMLIVS